MKYNFINQSTIRRQAKNAELQVAPEFLRELDDEVDRIFTKAIERCMDNKRTTLMGRDV